MMRKTGGNLANLTVKRGFGLLSAVQLMSDLAPTKSSWIVHETNTWVQQCGCDIRSSLADLTPDIIISRQEKAEAYNWVEPVDADKVCLEKVDGFKKAKVEIYLNPKYIETYLPV